MRNWKQTQPDTSTPSAKRQANLEAAYEAQKDTNAPYKDIEIQTMGELMWIMQQRHWSGVVDMPDGMQRANLSGASLIVLNLSEANLYQANLSRAHFYGANLIGADLNEADLSEADLNQVNLSGAHLYGANLSRAYIGDAKLIWTTLTANLSGAYLTNSDLSGADLRNAKFDSDTALTNITLSTTTKLRDIRWNGVNLTSIEWNQLPRLGDDADNNATNTDKARANRQLATQLRTQGINTHADRFAYRANVFERRANFNWNPLTWLPWLGSLLLDGVTGYGYKPGRILFWYLITIAGFTLMYMKASEGWIPFGLPTPTSLPRLPWYEALILSVSSFHGRGFFQPVQSLGDPIAALASIEAVVGLFIEVSFIATFTQRFFGK